MKYLYPYECERLHLSTLSELQYAVDGNKREGKKPQGEESIRNGSSSPFSKQVSTGLSGSLYSFIVWLCVV